MPTVPQANHHNHRLLALRAIHQQNYRGEIALGPGIIDILDTSRAIAAYATRVAAEAIPPPLPSE